MLAYPVPYGTFDYEKYLLDGYDISIHAPQKLDVKTKYIPKQQRYKDNQMRVQQQQQNIKQMNHVPFAKPNGFNHRFLRELGKLRQDIQVSLYKSFAHENQHKNTYESIINKMQCYFENIYVMHITMENYRNLYHTYNNIPTFSWLGASSWNDIRSSLNSEIFHNTCWRFELIMTAHMLAVWYYNYGVSLEANGDMISSHKQFVEAYKLERHVCLEQIKSWSRRNEQILPFESTKSGVESMISFCMIKIQHHIITIMCYDFSHHKPKLVVGTVSTEEDDKEDEDNGLPKLADIGVAGISQANLTSMIERKHASKIQYCMWMYQEILCLQRCLRSRFIDGTAIHIDRCYLLDAYRVESIALILFYNSKESITLGFHKRAVILFEHAASVIDDFMRLDVNSSIYKTNEKYNSQDYNHHVTIIKDRLDLLDDMITQEIATISRDGTNLLENEDPLDMNSSVWSLLPISTLSFFKNVSTYQNGMDMYKVGSDKSKSIIKNMFIQ